MAEGSKGSGSVPDPAALQQFSGVRQVFQDQQYQNISQVYWNRSSSKRGPPTPVASTPATTPHEQAPDSTMEVDTEGDQTTTHAELLQPFSLQTDAALSVTAGALGVDINSQAELERWKQSEVGTNEAVFNMVRAYHKKVIRPEYFSLICQIEASMKQLHDKIFVVKKSLAWMVADNRLQQKYACGTQLLTVGWHQGLSPSNRNYMISWLLSQTPVVVNFLTARGFVSDHNAHDMNSMHSALSPQLFHRAATFIPA